MRLFDFGGRVFKVDNFKVGVSNSVVTPLLLSRQKGNNRKGYDSKIQNFGQEHKFAFL